MGEGGVSPEYFHEKMTYGEANDFLRGLQRRYRQSWEQTRLSVDIAARCAGNKDGVPIEFPWDSESSKSKEVSAEELAMMYADARALERKMNRKL